MAIITYPLNGIEYDASDAETYLCTRSSGVFSADEHFKASITDDREVTISTGLAWINNDAFAGKSVANTAPVAVSIPVSDGALDRIDRIVLRFDKAANASTIALIQGTPASAPVAPAVTQASTLYELGLYTILVPAASTVVLASHITDTRADETVCGLMSDAVSKISTTKIVGPKYTISLEPDTADKAASVIRIKDNASGNTRVLIAANEDANNAENDVSQIVLRDGTNVGKVNIQCNTSGAKGIRITDDNNVERIKLHYTTTDDMCLFEIKDENGNDVTLETIGAQERFLCGRNQTIATSAWASDTTYTEYPYRASVALPSITALSFVEIVFSPADATSGNFAPVCDTYTGGVYLYAKAVPDADITIPTIIVWR